MAGKPIALDAYETLAEAYASVVDTKPHNAYYERPATLSLLPNVNGKRVLDAGCGPGVYSEWLIERGARTLHKRLRDDLQLPNHCVIHSLRHTF